MNTKQIDFNHCALVLPLKTASLEDSNTFMSLVFRGANLFFKRINTKKIDFNDHCALVLPLKTASLEDSSTFISLVSRGANSSLPP